MITGTVNRNRQPIILLTVQAADGSTPDLEAMVDTGFNGWLTLPSTVISALGLRWRRKRRATLADGSAVFFDVYDVTIVWDGQPRFIPVDSAESIPLVGMSTLYGYEMCVHAVDGGQVLIRVP